MLPKNKYYALKLWFCKIQLIVNPILYIWPASGLAYKNNFYLKGTFNISQFNFTVNPLEKTTHSNNLTTKKRTG